MHEGIQPDTIKSVFVHAMAAEFDPARWLEVGARFGCERVIREHPLLLRSDANRDGEYLAAVAEVVPALLGQKSYGGRVVELTNLAEMESLVGLRGWITQRDPTLAAELYGATTTDVSVAKSATPREPTADASTDRRTVFLVHGRDHDAREALADLLRSFDLRILSWDDASALTGVATPYTGDVVAAGMDASDAVVVLMTPDDLAHVRPEFALNVDGETESVPTGQPRMNVIFEAGMALARDRDGVVLVQVGKLRTMSDIAGLNVIQLGEDVESRRQLGLRLRQVGLATDMEHDRWRTAGSFTPR